MKTRKRILAVITAGIVAVSTVSAAGYVVAEPEIEIAREEEEVKQEIEKSEEVKIDPTEEPETEESELQDKEDNSAKKEELIQDETEEQDAAYADEKSESSSIEPENTENTDNQTEEEEQDSDSVKVDESAEALEAAHVAANVTNEKSQLKLNLGNAWFMDNDKNRISLPELTNAVDFSSVGSIKTAGMDLLYRLNMDGEERTIHAGDWYEISFPSILKNVRTVGSESYVSENLMDIVDIQTNGNTVKVIFKESIDGNEIVNIHGCIHLAFEVDCELLSEDITEYSLTVQEENIYSLKFPASIKSSDEEDCAGIENVKTLFSTILKDYFADVLQYDLLSEEVQKIINDTVKSMASDEQEMCYEKTLEAMDAFDLLSYEDAEAFMESEPGLYHVIMESLAEALAEAMAEGEISTMSLLPLEEVKAYLVLNGKTSDELKNMSVDEILGMLQDAQGNKISISESATTVWRYMKNDQDNIEEYKKYLIGKGEIIDLTAANNALDYQLELIVGSDNQLDSNNIRYIIKVYVSDKIAEEFSFELYSQPDSSVRNKLVPKQQRFVQGDSGITASNGYSIPSWNYIFVMNEGEYENPYIGITSLMNEHPEFELRIYEESEYIVNNMLGFDIFQPVTKQLLNQNMLEINSGYRLTSNFVSFVVLYYREGVQVDAIVLSFLLSGDSSEITGDLFKTEDGNKTSVVESMSYSFSATDETYTFNLKNGYADTDEYSLSLNAVSGTDGNVNEKIIKAVVGDYSSLEEAEGETDIKNMLFSDIGYRSNFSGKGVQFTLFFNDTSFGDSEIYHFTVKVKSDDQIFHSYTEAPIVGAEDPWFRVTGVTNKNGEVLDTYIVENGKSNNIDTAYGYGYQTVMINSNETVIKPIFDFMKSESVNVTEIRKNGEIFSEDNTIELNDTETIVDFYVTIEDEAGEHTKRYPVSFVKKSQGAKLFVVNPKGDDVTRSVFLTQYFESKHDILIANVGDELLTGIKVELDATHCKLDDYWTVGGENNDTLAPFEYTSSNSEYSELQNLAKIRLLPDGEGEIKGTLKISADGQETVVINLSGRAVNPSITTVELKDAVKWVPYSYMVTTDNMYDWNAQKFSIISGALPEGMELNTDTGEIYGAPNVPGEYTFTIQANYSYEDFEPSQKEFTITVLDNEDQTVYETSDAGYAIVPDENGDIGYVGEQVSAYSFVLTNLDDDEIYVSEGDFDQFVKLWLNGEPLSEGDYEAVSGSTRITIKSETLQNKTNPGRNTISAEYNINGERGESLKRTSQNFTVEVKQVTTVPTQTPDKPVTPTPIPIKPATPTPIPVKPVTPTVTEKPDKPEIPIAMQKPTDASASDITQIPEKPNVTGTPDITTEPEVKNTVTPSVSGDTVISRDTMLKPTTCIVYMVDENDLPIKDLTLELHSTPQIGTTGSLGTAVFTNVEFGNHTIYVKDQEDIITASKSFTIRVSDEVSLNGDTILAREGQTFTVKMQYKKGQISLISVQNGIKTVPKTADDSPLGMLIAMLLISLLMIVISGKSISKKQDYR